jgi:hypothetical protein
MQHVRSYCAAVFRERDERYRSRLSTGRRIVFDALRAARPVLHTLKRLREAWQLVGKYGALAAASSETSKARQLVDQMALYLRDGVLPKDYYQYTLYRREKRRQASAFIYHHQMDALLNPLAEQIAADDAEVLHDKRQFWRFCEEHDIAAIPVLATFPAGKGEVEASESNKSIPAHDLFSKPLDRGQGVGARRWEHIGNGNYQSVDGHLVTVEELTARLTAQAAQMNSPIILQPRIRNHASLERLTGPTLSSARVITIREPGGEAELLTGVIFLPVDNEVTSNFSGGGLGAPIDAETGMLGKARFKDPDRVMDTHAEHPSTGQRIEGFELPGWKAAVELACGAHNMLPQMPFVGWDVAFTQEGPMLIEGNTGFGADGPQLIQGRPLGETNLPVYHQQHVQASTS